MNEIEKSDIWIVIPAYNESSRIAPVLTELLTLGYPCVVVDDGSQDDTYQVISKFNCAALKHPINLGAGAATQTGVTYALKKGAKLLVHFDADGQMQTKDIPAMMQPILENKADVVFGTRFKTESDSVPLSKKYFIHQPAIILNLLLTGIKLTDAHCGFRAFSKAAAELCTITQNRMSHATELMDLVKIHKLRYAEVPVDILYHRYGQTFLDGFKILRDLAISKIIKFSR